MILKNKGNEKNKNDLPITIPKKTIDPSEPSY
jgi:hypothetical protein